jgi:carboxylesterase
MMIDTADLSHSSSVSDPGAPFDIERGSVGCLLIHGFTGTPWALRELGFYLADRDITVAAPLLPGHGTHPEDLLHVSWQSWVEESHRALNVLKKGCDKVFILGFSMGGAIALWLAAEEQVSGVITLSAPIQLTSWKIHLLPVIRPFITYWKKGKRSIRDLNPGMGYDCYPIRAVDELIQMLMGVRDRLSRITCPVLILHARGDRRIPVQNAQWIYEGIPSHNKQIVLMDGKDHLITKGENKTRVFQESAEFILSHQL